MTKHLIIIDGYGFLFRAYHSMPPLKRPDGVPVGAIYGFTNMMMKITRDLDSSHIALALDSGVKSFRNEIYSEYKAHRPPAPDDLIPQFPLVRDAANALNIKILEKNGFEADDLIATFVKQAVSENYRVTIVSSDKDLMQLIEDDKIKMFDAMKNKFIDENYVREKFGVGPGQLLDVLALMGDSSDNIPGVPGIGPKTASELINLYGTLDNLYEHVDEIKQIKRREGLIENKAMAFLSKKLITLDENVASEIKIDDLAVKAPISEQLIAFLKQQNFKSLVARIESNGTTSGKPTQPAAQEHIIDKKHLPEILKKAQEEGFLAIDYELEAKSEIVTKVFLATDEKQSYCLNLREDNEQTDFLATEVNPLSLAEFVGLVKNIFASESVLKLGFNIKKMLHIFRLGEIMAFEDLELASYLLENGEVENNLNSLVSYHLGIENKARGANIIKLWNILKTKLFASKMLTLYGNIEKPLVKVLYNMECTGIKTDITVLNTLSEEFKKKIQLYEKKIFTEAGMEFNVGSPKQLSEVLFQNMGIALQNGAKNKTGSTNAEILEELSASGYDIARNVLEWRHFSKLKNTYTDSLPKQIDRNGRIHTSYLMTSTSTGRLSSVEPNLQNIPIRTPEGNLIRSAFVADTGKVLVSADYSQIELRLLAHIGGVKSLINAFKNNLDIHKATAAEMFGVELDQVEDDLRRRAKTINFGIIYGISAFGLANRLGIPRNVAKDYIEMYFRRYPEIQLYMEKTKEFARTHGYVQTLFGRKCFLKTINSKNQAERSFAERAAINAPLQGTQADIIKIAMTIIAEKIKASSAKMLLQIHDELLFEVNENEAEKTANLVKSVMENVAHYSIPLTVDVRIGKNWQEI